MPPRNLARLLAGLLCLLQVGCGAGGEAVAPGRGRDLEDSPAPTTAAVEDPRLELELAAESAPGLTAYALDMVQFTVRVRSRDPADLAIPGPPHLRLVIRDVETQAALRTRPHPLRGRPPRHFPLSVEAGESLSLGPFGLDLLDLDPRELRPGRGYRLEAEYRSGEAATPRTAALEAVLVTARELDFPEVSPLEAAPAARPAVMLAVLDSRGRPRRVYGWSPDTGLQADSDPR